MLTKKTTIILGILALLPQIYAYHDAQDLYLNTACSFASHRIGEPWVSVNELVQNLIDEATKQCKSAVIFKQSPPDFNIRTAGITTTDVFCVNQNEPTSIEYNATGYIARIKSTLYPGNPQLENLELINVNSTLPWWAFMHGQSTKKNSDSDIGYFGDGLKVSVSLLLQLRVDIAIYNNDQRWVPICKPIDKYKDENISGLFLAMTNLTTPNNILNIALKNLPSSYFDTSRYLFLSPKEVLFQRKNVGAIILDTPGNNLYLKGFLLTKFTQPYLSNFSIDVQYSTSIIVDNYGMGRERTFVNERKLIGDVLIDMLHKSTGDEKTSLQLFLWHKLFHPTYPQHEEQDQDSVYYTENELSKILLESNSPVAIQETTKLLLTGLRHTFENITIAVGDHFGDRWQELWNTAHLLPLGSVTLVRLPTSWRNRISDYYTIKDVQKRVYNRLRKFPPFLPANKKDSEFLARLTALLTSNFPCIIKVHYINFRDQVVVLPSLETSSSSSSRLVELLLDPTILVQGSHKKDVAFSYKNLSNRIHQTLKSAHFHTCANEFEHAFNDRAKKLAEKFKDQEIADYFRQINAQLEGGISSAESASSLDDANTQTCDDNGGDGGGACARTMPAIKLESSAVVTSLRNETYVASWLESEIDKQQLGAGAGVGGSAIDNGGYSKRFDVVVKNLAVTQPSNIKTPIYSLKAPQVATLDPSTASRVYSPKGTLESHPFVEVCLQPEINLVRLDVNGSIVYVSSYLLRDTGSSSGSSGSITTTTTTTTTTENLPFDGALMRQFQTTIERSLVFLGHMKVAVNIFYDHSVVLGFNQGGHIYLNLASFKPSDLLDEAAASWAPVILHELAHNAVHGHGMPFIEVLQSYFGSVLLQIHKKEAI